ncbi:type II toxin-antitoxin system RelE/ParE family toxin [Thiohalocapsa marina]|uniref:Type II toxin-antitoxin system RelE/ParE family toxin n=1 Tax=Thiohalocapsa marina TaxID=424902 RepID=A0A5M8FEW2_9GAMM|nr:type II toxin-antitoxin system RelE/ParE family toxin [Thiohalocapsa marina]KAA6182246.1 type II toxin-antitoxin system RelE/ParE family toxin [Thiohalocapsa marina]
MIEVHKQAAAEDDLVAIWRDSFETWGAEQADRYLDELSEGLAALAANPHPARAHGPGSPHEHPLTGAPETYRQTTECRPLKRTWPASAAGNTQNRRP